MKKLLLFISTTFLGVNLFSQDVIHAADGSAISAKVLEVNTSDIKYKKYGETDGVVYAMNKSDVLSIHYSNGTNDFFSTKTISEANKGEENTQLASTEETKKVNGYNTASEPAVATQPASTDDQTKTTSKRRTREENGEILSDILFKGAVILSNVNHCGILRNCRGGLLAQCGRGALGLLSWCR